MYTSLMTDLIGVDADPMRSVALAARHGFEGVDLRIRDDADAIEAVGPDVIADEMCSLAVRPGYCSLLPGKIGCDDETWRIAFKQLPYKASLAERLGYTRTTTVILPFHETLDYDAAFAMHVARVCEVMPILADHGLRLGMEYVAPATRRAGAKYPFVSRMSEALRLIDACGRDGDVGVMLDTLHWHCAGETEDDIALLDPRLIVAVHLCDGLRGRTRDEQTVHERELPGASGVIDLERFMIGLARAGYDGPLTSEPTHPRWRGAVAEDACRATAHAVRRTAELARRPTSTPTN